MTTPIIRYARLPITPDINTMQHEVTALTSHWTPHFNTRHYEGQWTVLPLRSPGGQTSHIVPDLMQYNTTYTDTLLMQQCPAIINLLSHLHCTFMSVRLLNLQSGSVIKEHRDHELSFENGEARLHFPVFTNAQVEFYVDNQLVQMQEGDCWYINAQLPHRVANYGNADRIHLVVDCVVNDWLTEVFNRSQVSHVPQPQSNINKQRIIEELRQQNTEHANRLADEMENSSF
jgi:aspartyl/asparaginyl beta-hydroxylase